MQATITHHGILIYRFTFFIALLQPQNYPLISFLFFILSLYIFDSFVSFSFHRITSLASNCFSYSSLVIQHQWFTGCLSEPLLWGVWFGAVFGEIIIIDFFEFIGTKLSLLSIDFFLRPRPEMQIINFQSPYFRFILYHATKKKWFKKIFVGYFMLQRKNYSNFYRLKYRWQWSIFLHLRGEHTAKAKKAIELFVFCTAHSFHLWIEKAQM